MSHISSSIIGTRAIVTLITIIVIKILSLSGLIDLYIHACLMHAYCLMHACMLLDECMHAD